MRARAHANKPPWLHKILEIYLLALELLASPEERCLMELARESTSKFCCNNLTWLCYA